MSDQSTSEDHESRPDRSISRGQKLMLVAAVLFIAVGFGLSAMAGDGAPPATDQPLGQFQVNSLSAGALSTGGSATTDASGASGFAKDWSPFFMNGGFSFFLAFCMGYALRMFFKISAIFIGLAGLLLFGLAKAGVIEPDWGKMEGWFDVVAGHVKSGFASGKAFISGSLPSAGFATLGLYTGFKKG